MVLSLLHLPSQAALRVELGSSHQVHATHMAASLSGRMTATGAVIRVLNTFYIAFGRGGERSQSSRPRGELETKLVPGQPLDTTAAPMNRASVPEVSVNKAAVPGLCWSQNT